MIKDTFIYFLAKIMPAIISFAILFLFLNYLKPEEYGLYSLIIVSIGLLNILLNQWIRSSYLRFNGENSQSDELFFSKQFVFLIISDVLILILMMIIDLNVIIKLLILIMFNLLVINEFLNNYYRINLRPKIILMANLIRNILFLVSLLFTVFIMDNLDVYIALISYGIGLIFSTIYYFYFFKVKIKFKFDKELLVRSVKYGLPITIAFALGVLLQNIDKYMITYILDIEANGNYSLGFDFIHNFFYMVMSSLSMASLPRILKKSNDFNSMINQFTDYTKVFMYISIPFLLTLILISKEISDIFLTFNYNISSYLIIFIVIATFAHGVKSFIYDQAIQLYEKTTWIFVPVIVAITVNILINYLFMDKYGVTIAAFSSIVAFTTSALLTYVLIRKEIKIIFDYIYLLTAAGLSLIIHYAFQSMGLNDTYLNLIIKAFISLIIFSLLSLLFIFKQKENKNEKRRG